MNALFSFIFAIYLTALSIFHLSFALVLIASRSICFHNRVRFLWLWNCLLWSFVGFRRCRGRSFCLAARAGRCRCGCLMCRCALISCICLSRSALCCRRCFFAASLVTTSLVTTSFRLLAPSHHNHGQNCRQHHHKLKLFHKILLFLCSFQCFCKNCDLVPYTYILSGFIFV